VLRVNYPIVGDSTQLALTDRSNPQAATVINCYIRRASSEQGIVKCGEFVQDVTERKLIGFISYSKLQDRLYKKVAHLFHLYAGRKLFYFK
jgi:hypothetical protein